MHFEGGASVQVAEPLHKAGGRSCNEAFWCSVFAGATGATSKHTWWEEGLILTVKEAER